MADDSGYAGVLASIREPDPGEGVLRPDEAAKWLRDNPKLGDGPYAEQLANIRNPERPAVSLQAAQQKAEEDYNARTPAQQLPEFLARRSVPVASSLTNLMVGRGYQESLDRFKAGDASEADIQAIADYQHHQKAEAAKGTGATILGAAAHIPAILGEAAMAAPVVRGLGLSPALLRGSAQAGEVAVSQMPRAIGPAMGLGARVVGGTAAQTAMMPSMWLNQSQDRALQNGGNWYDSKNLGPAGAIGMAQVAVLGAISRVPVLAATEYPATTGAAGRSVMASGVQGWVTRMAAGTVTGMSGQQGIDLASKAAGWSTSWGAVPDMLMGKEGGFKHFASQAVVFALFSGLHAHQTPSGKPPASAMDWVKTAAEAYSKNFDGAEAEPAAEAGAKIFSDAMKGTLTREAAEKMPDGPEKDLAIKIVDNLPRTPDRSATQALPPDVIDGMAKSNTPLESIPDPSVRSQVEARRNALAGKAPQTAQDATSPPEAAKGPTPAEAPVEAKPQPGERRGDTLAIGKGEEVGADSGGRPLFRHSVTTPDGKEAGGVLVAPDGDTIHIKIASGDFGAAGWRGVLRSLAESYPDAKKAEFQRTTGPNAGKTQQVSIGRTARQAPTEAKADPFSDPALQGLLRQPGKATDTASMFADLKHWDQPEPVKLPDSEARIPLPEEAKTTEEAIGRLKKALAGRGQHTVGRISDFLKDTGPAGKHLSDAAGEDPVIVTDFKNDPNSTALWTHDPVGGRTMVLVNRARLADHAGHENFHAVVAALIAHEAAHGARARLGRPTPEGVTYETDPAELSANRAFDAVHKAAMQRTVPRGTPEAPEPPKAPELTPEAQEAEFRAAHPELTTPEGATAAVKAARRAVIDASKRGEDTTALKAQLEAALQARNAVASRIRQKKGGDQTLPPEMEASIKATDLTEQEKEAIIAKVTDSDSTRVLGEKLGVSRTTVLNRSKAALAKLQETDPDLWTDVNKRIEDLQTQALRQRAERQAADPRQELDHEDPVIQKDLEWDQPRLSKLSPEELAQELAETQRYLDDLAKSPDHANPEPAPVRPEDQPGLRGQAANPGAEAEAPGSPRDAAAEGQSAPAEAPPAGSDEARGDVVESRPVRDVGESRPEPTDPVMEAATEFAKQEGGFVTPEAILARAYDLAARLQATVRFVRNNWNEFAGNQFPRTARLSQNVAQKMVEWAHARTAALFGTPKYIDQIMGPLKAPAKTQLGRLGDAIRGQQVPQEARRMAGAIETQWRLDYMHDAYLKRSADLIAQAQKTPPGAEYARLTALATEARKDAANIGTIVGAKNSPLTSDAQYRAEMAKPEHQEIQRLWEKHMVPEMEANFKKAMGMDPADAIDSFTQRPGHPINLKNLGPEDAMTSSAVTAIPRGQGRGNLGNVRQGRLGFSRQAKGTGTYDIDLGAIIANSLGKGIAGAARAEALKAMIAEEVAHPGEPFKPKEGYTEFKDTFPQKGNALAEEGQTSLYVKNESAGEYRQALQVDAAPKFPLIHGFNTALTRTALASSVEFVYHGKNLMTFLFKPGVRWLGDPTKGESPVFPDVLKNAYRVARNTPEAQAELFELARMGRMKTPGMESGLILPERFKSADPTYYASRILDGVQKVMRLTASEAFDRMSGEKPYWLADAVKELTGKHPFENTELNKTDFINQLGQYNKKSQNALVVLMRDLGIAPFATAGTNYYVQSMRGLTGAPGARTNSWAGEVAARGEVFAKMTAVLGAVGAANYLAWGRPDGDDKTPLGSVKVGSQGGKTQYLDLTALTGLTRGARQTGLLALAEGERAGGKKGKTTAEEDKAYGDIVTSLLHPFMGPGPQFLHTAITGKDSLGVDVTQPKVGDQSDMRRDVMAAAWQANPALSVIRPEIQRGLGSAVSPKDREAKKPLEERAQKLLGPFGIKTKK